MTAKQQLRQLVHEFSEVESAEVLDILASRRRRDSLTELLDGAPLDDEPVTPEEEALVTEANADIAAGRMVSMAEILAEFGEWHARPAGQVHPQRSARSPASRSAAGGRP